MKQTTNYQLPQWEMTDRIRMEDFNDMTEKIDTALTRLAAGPKVVKGSYTGTGEAKTAHYSTGSRPILVLLWRNSITSDSDRCLLAVDGAAMNENAKYGLQVQATRVTFDDDGFSVNHGFTGAALGYNAEGTTQNYVALCI